MSDLGPGSDAVLRLAARIARHAGADLHVVHARGLLGISIREALVMLHASHIRQTENELEDQLRRVLPNGVGPASYGLDYQSAHLAVQHRAREVQADLVVIGPHEPRMPGIRPPDVSLAETAVQTGTPVLVVRAPLRWPPRRILLPVDQSVLSTGAFQGACAWLGRVLEEGGPPALARSRVLRVLHVARQLDGWRAFAPVLDAEVRRIEEAVAWDAGIHIRRSIRWGTSVSKQIRSVAAANRVDVVVLPSVWGQSGHGCTSHETAIRILREAPCSVVLLPEGAAGSDPSVDGAGHFTPHRDAPPRRAEEALIDVVAPNEVAAD